MNYELNVEWELCNLLTYRILITWYRANSGEKNRNNVIVPLAIQYKSLHLEKKQNGIGI